MNCFASSSTRSQFAPCTSSPIHRKLVVLGDGATGKTSMLTVRSRGYFPTGYEPTVFENYVCEVRVEGKLMELSLWDTAGQEEFDRLRSLSYADTHIVMACFAVNSRVSLENIESKWIPEVAEHCPNVKIVLVALKCDLREDEAYLQKTDGDVITYDEGLEVAKRIRAARYLECSAKHNRGVVEAFDMTASVALTARPRGGGSTGLTGDHLHLGGGGGVVEKLKGGGWGKKKNSGCVVM
ncbi:gtp-binding protein rho3 [Phaffia rhodozyma]|uniref:GTP-binding protein RHO3 n=1 Tax=Phaffia rhodozyma TaxID=264483 RepID=A0A0F7SI86_PHARH|nr:gtp-binding protein rho3 [Phaffia rhodozyma]